MAQAMGHPQWAEDARFATLLERLKHQDELDALITTWTSERDHYDVMRTLQDAHVKSAPVLDGKELLFDPHFRERHHFDVIDQPLLGRRPVQRNVAAKFRRFEAKSLRPAPLLGEHNEEVLREIGYSDDQIAKLKEDGVIADRPNLPVPPQIVSMALKLPYDRYIPAGILQAIEPDYREQLGIADDGAAAK
jgi:crotonobetainyl-CoA:carnitine CoA-transferase CaiB-like acyl-CoA transferase